MLHFNVNLKDNNVSLHSYEAMEKNRFQALRRKAKNNSLQ
jgi:hypothetical protein